MCFRVFSAIVLEFRNQPMAVLRRAITRPGMCLSEDRKKGKYVGDSPQSNLNSAQILPPLLSTSQEARSPIHFVLFNSCIFFSSFNATTTAPKSFSRQTRQGLWGPRFLACERVEARRVFREIECQYIRGTGNFKQLLESSHVLLRRNEKTRARNESSL